MKVGFVSLGCPKNLVDTEVMLGLVEQAGHTLTADAATADVIVVNTCAFIDRAKEESVETILEMAERRRNGSCQRLVVTGCLAERYREALAKEIPEIDAILGTGEIPAIVDAITGRREATAHPVRVIRRRGKTLAEEPPEGGRALPGGLPGYLNEAAMPRVLTTPRHYAYLKVAEGCDYACAFCIIPRLRGPYRSRSVESIEQEARALAERGVRELILVSQDTTYYGVDRGERGALARLLRRLNEIDGLAWIRLLYLYPTTITDEVLAAMAECEKVCKYIDLPLQHVAKTVLARMRRPGDERQYRRLIEKIRARVAGVALRTTFIVGFPGETPAEFDELCRFIQEVRFDHLGVFPYSHEEGTAAYRRADDVPAREKRRRREVLLRLQRAIVAETLSRRRGERVRVMVDGPSAESPLVLQGRLASQAPEIDSVVYLTECDPTALHPGDLVDAEVVAAYGYDLVVRPLPGAGAAGIRDPASPAPAGEEGPAAVAPAEGGVV